MLISGESSAVRGGAIMIIRKAADMDTISLVGTRLVGEVLEQHPQGKEILRRHFGEKFLDRQSVKILSLSLACLLRGVSLASLTEELRGFPPGKGESFS